MEGTKTGTRRPERRHGWTWHHVVANMGARTMDELLVFRTKYLQRRPLCVPGQLSEKENAMQTCCN